jgi:hypothetical protein
MQVRRSISAGDMLWLSHLTPLLLQEYDTSLSKLLPFSIRPFWDSTAGDGTTPSVILACPRAGCGKSETANPTPQDQISGISQ